MNNWRKGIVLTTDRDGLPGQIHCAECCGIISPGTKFYMENYEDEYELNTRYFHFNCVQAVENRTMLDVEIPKIKEDLADVLSRKAGVEEEVAQAENNLLELDREESDLRKKIGKLVEGEGAKNDRDRQLSASSFL